MSAAFWTRCKGCDEDIVILDTKRGKRIAVNRTPKGHRAFMFRGVARIEELYIYGTHQPHVITCTKPRDKTEPQKKKFV